MMVETFVEILTTPFPHLHSANRAEIIFFSRSNADRKIEQLLSSAASARRPLLTRIWLHIPINDSCIYQSHSSIIKKEIVLFHLYDSSLEQASATHSILRSTVESICSTNLLLLVSGLKAQRELKFLLCLCR